MKNIIKILLVSCLTITLNAQQDITFSLYSFNSSILNPAHAGTHKSNEIYAMSRLQWLGVDGAPRSYAVTANLPFQSKFGASAGILVDELGPTRRTIAYGDIGTHINVSSKVKLSFGLRGKATSYSVQLTRLAIIEQNDASYFEDIDEKTNFNVGYGAVLYDGKFYLGFSSPSAIETSVETNGTKIILENRHYYGYVGYKFRVGDHLSFNPSILIKQVNNTPLDLDLNLMAIVKEKVSASLMYSHLDAVGANISYDLNAKLRLGVAYEVPITNLSIGSITTLEFAIRYITGKERSRAVSPVYFNY